MKVKIFSKAPNKAKSAKDRIESEINGWLKSNPGIKIKFATHSETSDEADFYWITVLVWYEEKSPVQ